MDDDIVIRTLARIAAETFRTSALFVKFISWRLLDVISLVFNVIAVCTLVRIPSIIHVIKSAHQTTNRPYRCWSDLWHFLGIIQTIIFITDIPFLLMTPVLLVFFWRAILLYQEHGPIQYPRSWGSWGYEGWQLRRLIWKHFCLLCTDFLIIPFSVCLCLSWRGPRFVRQLRQQFGDEVRWKMMLFKEFLMLLNEVVCFPIIGCLILSWRSKMVRKRIIRELDRSGVRLDNVSDFRLVYMLSSEVDRGSAFCVEWSIVVAESIYFIMDLVTLPLLICLLFSWRHSITWDLFKPWYINNLAVFHNASPPDYNEKIIRARIWGQFFGGLLVDILHLPLFPPILCSWRIFLFYKSLKPKFSEEPIITDPPESLQHRRQHHQPQPEATLDSLLFVVRAELRHHCFALLSDIVCIVSFYIIVALAPVFPWRLRRVVRKISIEYNTNTITERSVKERIIKELMLAIGDIPTLIVGMIICITIWRVPFLVGDVLLVINSSDRQRKNRVIARKVYKNFYLLILDGLTAPFAITTVITLWRLKPFAQQLNQSWSSEPSQHWKYCLASYNGRTVRKAAVLNALCLVFVDIPCLFLFLVNTVFLLRLPAILSSLLNCGSFHSEYPFILIAETLNLLVDLAFLVLGCVLLILRPVAVVQHLLEDEKHRKVRELKEAFGTVKHVLSKSPNSTKKLEEMVNILVKSYSSSDNKLSKYLLSKVIVEYTTDFEYLRMKLMEKYVDDKFIYLMTKYLFLKDKHAHFMYRRFLIERIHLKRPSYYARLKNLDLFQKEYNTYIETLQQIEDELTNFEIEKIPLWEIKIGFLSRSRKENQAVVIKTLKNGYFATLLFILLNCGLIYRAIPLLLQIYHEPFLIRKKAVKNLEQYWLDLKCLGQILIVVISIYRCPDLVSDLIVDIFCKRSVSAIRKTVGSYQPHVLKDIKKVLVLLLKWRTVAYVIASTMFFCFIPLSAIINISKTISTSRWKVLGGSALLYLLLIFVPVGILVEEANRLVTKEHQLFEYLSLIFVILAVFVGVSSKKRIPLQPVDYVRINWGLIHLTVHEACQLGQILAMLFSLSPEIDHSKQFVNFFKIFLLASDDPDSNINTLNYMFYCWFLISSAPVILEGVLKYVPQGRFSNNNFSWQFMMSFFGSTMFIIIPYLGIAFLTSTTVDGVLLWSTAPGKAGWCMMFVVWYLLTSTLFYNRYFNTANSVSDLQFSPIYNSIINLIKLALVVLFAFIDLPTIVKIGILIISVVIMIAVSLLYPKVIQQKPCNSTLLMAWRISILVIIILIALTTLVTELYPAISGITSLFIPIIISLNVIIMASMSRDIRKHSANELAREKFIETIQSIELMMTEKNLSTISWSKTRTGWLNLLKVVRVANEHDKQAEQPVEHLFMELEPVIMSTVAPPSYDQVTGDDELQTYNEVNAFSPPSGIIFDSDFVPDLEFLTTAVGDWLPYSAENNVREFAYLDGYCDLTQTITDQKCTGSQILLMLEKHVHYMALSRSCVQNLSVWRALVAKSNWIGLNKYVDMLKRAMTCDYDTPKTTGVIVHLIPDDYLNPNHDESYFPDYVESESLYEIKLRVHIQKRETLLSLLPPAMSRLFGKLIPAEVPMLRNITEAGTTANLQLTCKLFKSTNICIVSVPGEGFKIAAGAQIQIPKVWNIEVSSDTVKFCAPYPVASKAILSTEIQMLKLFEVDGITRLGVSNDPSKTAEFPKVLETLPDLSWDS